MNGGKQRDSLQGNLGRADDNSRGTVRHLIELSRSRVWPWLELFEDTFSVRPEETISTNSPASLGQSSSSELCESSLCSTSRTRTSRRSSKSLNSYSNPSTSLEPNGSLWSTSMLSRASVT